MKVNKNKFEVDLDSLPLDIALLSEIKNPLIFVPKLTFQGFAKEIVEKYTCMICQEVYNNPVTTKCNCKVTLCERCFKMNHSRCPICRSYTNADINHMVKNEIEDQEFVCECKTKYKYGRKEDHVLDCEKASLTCSKCDKSFNGPNLKKHLVDLHTIEILMSFGKISIV
jgi:hypothetical protein